MRQTEDTTEAKLDTVARDLAGKYSGTFSEQSIRLLVQDSYERLSESATVTMYLPVLTARFARTRLQALARADGHNLKETPEILFLCVHNAGRSQMAAAWMDHLSGGKVTVRSAGSAPTGDVNPTAIAAMAEVGIELTEAYPKPMTDDVVRASDVIVTMGCGDACPVYPGKRYLDWDIPDPAGRPMSEVRAIRDNIRGRVETLLTELAMPTTQSRNMEE
ncbi:MAG: arsenate reductase ArsC [Actinomycetes bacterium]